jgi:hypothetical protein
MPSFVPHNKGFQPVHNVGQSECSKADHHVQNGVHALFAAELSVDEDTEHGNSHQRETLSEVLL